MQSLRAGLPGGELHHHEARRYRSAAHELEGAHAAQSIVRAAYAQRRLTSEIKAFASRLIGGLRCGLPHRHQQRIRYEAYAKSHEPRVVVQHAQRRVD